MNILILGGTQEAVSAANMLHQMGHRVTTTLSGVTVAPTRPSGNFITGGFGGPDGLFNFLQTNTIDYLIDATHPFAAKMSASAVISAQKAKVPLVRLLRPPFEEISGANWWYVDSKNQAAEKLPSGANVLLSIGRLALEPFLTRADIRFVLRSIEKPEYSLPENFTSIRDRPPYARQDEVLLMKHHGITHLVSKNSGGTQTQGKLEAAFMLRIQVVMISRPPLPPAREVQNIEELEAIFSQLPAAGKRSFFLPLLRKIWAKPES